MTYSISEISKKFNLPISTLRFYDKEDLLVDLERDTSGNRKFNDKTVEALILIECLKRSGMQIKDIKEFMYWVSLGDKTISKRKSMFLEQKKNIEHKINELQKALDMINFKCWYYDTAEKDKTEEKVKHLSPNDMPDDIRIAYKNAHQI